MLGMRYIDDVLRNEEECAIIQLDKVDKKNYKIILIFILYYNDLIISLIKLYLS